MRSELLDLEYEFDMEDVMVGIMAVVAAVCIFVIWGYYMLTDNFIYASAIPFILLLVFYVVLDDHNDQIKERNDVRLKISLETNAYHQLMHMTAISYLHGDYNKK